MAHFAKLDENNIVTQVIVVKNDVLLKTDGTESEYKGKVFLNQLFGNSTWVQTSYNGNFRRRMAGVGMKYDNINDVFIVVDPPFDNWVRNEDFDWVPPVPYPDTSIGYEWNQEENTWYELTPPYPSWTWNHSEGNYFPPVERPFGAYQWNEETTSWDLISE